MKKQSGFTLIEMVVVMAIIAIVAMMAMPSPDPTFARRQVQEGMTLTQD